MAGVGVVYVAYGDNAKAECRASIEALTKNNKLPVAIISDGPVWDCARGVVFDRPGAGARWAKLNIPCLVDYDTVVYLDADTRPHGDLEPLIEIAQDWEMVISPSENQGTNALQHIKAKEREKTLQEINNLFPLQAQCGVMVFNRLRCLKLFEAWREEWQRYKQQDQAAFLRALYREPVRVWLVGRDWNNGEMIQHLFGRAR